MCIRDRYIAIIATFSSDVCIAGLGSDDEVRLVEDMFTGQGYNQLIRPVENLTEKVKVEVQLALIQIIDVVRTLRTFVHGPL